MHTSAADDLFSESVEAKRLRRHARKGKIDPEQAAEKLYGKKLEDWDDEELAHGRPRNAEGNFGGKAPAWLTPALQEEAQRRFREILRTKANVVVLRAPKVIGDIMLNEDEDEDGRPKVAAGVRLEAAKYLMDHVIGRPTQPVDVNANVKLQAMLGQVIVQGGDEGEEPAVGFADRIDWQEGDDGT